MELREYQIDVKNGVRDRIRLGDKRIIVHAGTGAGKTVIAASIIQDAKAKGSSVLFLANRRELIFQAVDTLEKSGVSCGVIMAGEEPDFSKDVQVASMQTYVRRMDLAESEFNQWWHKANIVIVDECHSAISPSYRKILDEYDGTVSIGLTATPCGSQGRGLGEYYQSIVSAISVEELIKQDFLVPCRYFAPSKPDLEKIKMVAGDYDKKELGRRVTPLIGDVFLNWARVAGGLQTIIFAVDVKHSISIKDEFEKHGISMVHVDAKTPKDIRKDALDDLKSGRIQVITNVGILTHGFDYPEAGCIILARPTKSLSLYLQMAGRGLRPAPGKSEVVILDHGGCIEEHGLIEWDRAWSLDGKNRAWSKPSREKTEKVVKCRACHLVFEGSNTCPECGTVVITFGKKIPTIEAELEELDAKKVKYTSLEKRQYLGMMRHWVDEKGYNSKMILAKYRTRFDCWPGNGISDVGPIEPNLTFLNLMKHDFIRYAKSKQKKKAVDPESSPLLNQWGINQDIRFKDTNETIQPR